MKINLHELRIKNGLTVRGLANISGVGAGTISKIERGNMNPSLLTICRLCCAGG
ncbi:DNA-binding XRE family transcriptional regulator [Kineothrix alysoides]|uniref:DNA-binding XRE family transcriptional regulator n=1 Tax=Kineothrix alysoides TaxID=1469948 RepID=A0A4R1QL49_9FIRM|nr:helix-turn-helix transcriptional regulator [Kineothrix alysoides]TCL54409.1 DNA-binding XRE family transcriptional regulator [Kineothrix alysoides]